MTFINLVVEIFYVKTMWEPREDTTTNENDLKVQWVKVPDDIYASRKRTNQTILKEEFSFVKIDKVGLITGRIILALWLNRHFFFLNKNKKDGQKI